MYSYFFFWRTESAENIPSVQISLQQATCQASKLLLATTRDYKKLEVNPAKRVSKETSATTTCL